MIRTELEQLEKMKYDELCTYLKNKYGEVQGDYFLNETCKTANPKIKRSSEGLFVHHIKETEYITISNPKMAIVAPYEYQKAENLVYCDYIEHMLLHICIVKEYMTQKYADETGMIVGIGGLFRFIFPEIIDYINGYEYKKEYMITALKVVDGNEDFIAKTIIDFRKYLDDFDNNEEKILLIDSLFGPDHNMFEGKMTKIGRFNEIVEENSDIVWSSIDDIKHRIRELYSKRIFGIEIQMGSHREGILRNYYLSYALKGVHYNEEFFVKDKKTFEVINQFLNETFDRFRYGEYYNCFVYINKESEIRIEENKKSKNKYKKYNIVINDDKLSLEYTEAEAADWIRKYKESKKALG